MARYSKCTCPGKAINDIPISRRLKFGSHKNICAAANREKGQDGRDFVDVPSGGNEAGNSLAGSSFSPVPFLTRRQSSSGPAESGTPKSPIVVDLQSCDMVWGNGTVTQPPDLECWWIVSFEWSCTAL